MVAAAERDFTSLASRLGLTTKQAEEVFDRIPVPDSLPAIKSMLWDAGGNLWIGTRAGLQDDVGDYQVLDQRGRWLSMVKLPFGVSRIFCIGESHLLVEWQDEYGVPYLQVYRLRKPAG
jgi:hypothetical protein